MRILAIYRHYAPDATPYAQILRLILEHLASNGHDVSVFTAQPSYNGIRRASQPWRESLHGVDVRRVRLMPERKKWIALRAFNFAYFLMRAIGYAAIGRPFDMIIANSHPPVLMGGALRIIRALRGTRYIYHCQDIHPEAAALVGDTGTGWLYRRMLKIDTSTCRRAARIVVLSQDMANTLTERGVGSANVSIINNPPLPARDVPCSKPPAPLDAPSEAVRFLFAGNLGRFQGLEPLIRATRLVARSVPFQVIFMGEGAIKDELIRLAGDLLNWRIVFVSQLSVGAAVAAMRACDYGIVSLLPGVARLAYPSKSMTYWAAGCPVLALLEDDCELARTIAHEQLGYVASNGSLTSIATGLTRAVAERHHWTVAERLRIASVAQHRFGSKRMLAEWDEMVESVFPSVKATGRASGQVIARAA